MKNLFEKIVITPLEDSFQRLVKFLPNLLGALTVLILGVIFGWIIELVIIKILKSLKADSFAQRTGLTQTLEKGGIKRSPTIFIGRIFYWLTMVIFIIMALYTLRIPTVENLLEKFFLYLPNVFIAALIIIIGYTLSNFLATAILITSVNAGLKFAGLLSKSVKLAIFLFAVTMALEQLAIGSETVIIAFTIFWGGIVLAISLAFGLAGKDMAKEYLEKKFKGGEEEKKDDIQHL